MKEEMVVWIYLHHLFQYFTIYKIYMQSFHCPRHSHCDLEFFKVIWLRNLTNGSIDNSPNILQAPNKSLKYLNFTTSSPKHLNLPDLRSSTCNTKTQHFIRKGLDLPNNTKNVAANGRVTSR